MCRRRACSCRLARIRTFATRASMRPRWAGLGTAAEPRSWRSSSPSRSDRDLAPEGRLELDTAIVGDHDDRPGPHEPVGCGTDVDLDLTWLHDVAQLAVAEAKLCDRHGEARRSSAAGRDPDACERLQLEHR